MCHRSCTPSIAHAKLLWYEIFTQVNDLAMGPQSLCLAAIGENNVSSIVARVQIKCTNIVLMAKAQHQNLRGSFRLLLFKNVNYW